MKSLLFRGLLALLLLSLTFGAVTCAKLERAASGVGRLLNNQQVLTSKIAHHKTKDSLNAATVQTMRMTAAEYKSAYQKEADRAKSLGIDNKRLTAAAHVAAHTETVVKTVFRDSLIYVDGKIDTLRCLKYSDRWTSLNGYVGKDSSFVGKINSREELDLYLHVVPKRFLFIKYGVRQVNASAVSGNPNTIIDSLQVVRFTYD